MTQVESGNEAGVYKFRFVLYESYYMKGEEFGLTYSSLILQILLESKRIDGMEDFKGNKI